MIYAVTLFIRRCNPGDLKIPKQSPHSAVEMVGR